ncbi:MAG: hypothetical protein MHM6MM_008032 [Cercozoa sp. M6MM]
MYPRWLDGMVREPRQSHVSFCADDDEFSGVVDETEDLDHSKEKDDKMGDSALVELHDLVPQNSLGVAIVKDEDCSKKLSDFENHNNNNGF